MCAAAPVFTDPLSRWRIPATPPEMWNVSSHHLLVQYVLLTSEHTRIGDPIPPPPPPAEQIYGKLCDYAKRGVPTPSTLHPTPVASVFDFSIFNSACQSFLYHPLILSSHRAWLNCRSPVLGNNNEHFVIWISPLFFFFLSPLSLKAPLFFFFCFFFLEGLVRRATGGLWLTWMTRGGEEKKKKKDEEEEEKSPWGWLIARAEHTFRETI